MPLDPNTGLPGGGGSKKKPKPVPQFDPAYGGANPGSRDPGSTESYPGSGRTTTIPGWQPNWQQIIANDPNFLQTQKELTAQSFVDEGSRNAAINRALIGYGGIPDLDQAGKALGFNLGSIVDPMTAQTAANNPFSTQGLLHDAHSHAISAIRRALAARGGLQSGELGSQLGEENKGYGKAQYDSAQQLLDYVAGRQSAYTDSEKERQAALAAARAHAADFQSQQPGNQPTGSQTGHLDPEASARAGQPLYKGEDGRWYTQDGQPYDYNPSSNPPPPPPAAAPATQSTGINPATGLPGTNGGGWVPRPGAGGVGIPRISPHGAIPRGLFG